MIEALKTLEGFIRLSNVVSDEDFGVIMKENLPALMKQIKKATNPPRKERVWSLDGKFSTLQNRLAKERPAYTQESCEHTEKHHNTDLCRRCYDKLGFRWRRTGSVKKPSGRNRKIRGLSKYRGLTFERATGQYIPALCIKGKRYRLQRYSSEVKAAKAYDKLAKSLLGEQAVLNFP